MEGLINVQIDLQNSIKKALANFKKSPKERINKEYVECRLENLERDWELFRTNNAKLYETLKPEEIEKSKYVSREVQDVTEDNYFVYKALLKESLKKFMSSEPKVINNESDKSGSSLLVRLPKISIPNFSGQYSEWTTFHDLFVSLVHNNDTLGNVQKLHYLKTHLTGEAAQLIRHTPITDANYSQCWSLLVKRYNNKKYLVDCILKRLFGQRRLNVESASGLKELVDTTMDCINALKNMEIDVSTWDIMIIYIVMTKLDPETRKQWELHISDTNELPTMNQLQCFLESRFRALEFVDSKRPPSHHSGPHTRPKVLVATNVSGMTCEFCAENHKLCFCKKFAKQDTDQRREFVAKNSICFNCLGSNHIVYNCNKPTSCRICKKRHHTLLHAEHKPDAEPVEGASSSASTSQIVSCLSTKRVMGRGQVLLATALVDAESGSGRNQIVRALLDQGSQACFITEAAVQLLRLKKNPVRGRITGLGGDKGLTSKYLVTINLKSRIDKEFNLKITAYVLKNITSYLPDQKVESIDWVDLKDLCLADPQFNTPNKVDLLLGANVLCHILKDGLKRCPTGTLIAQNTSLGWILSGTVMNDKVSISGDEQNITAMHAQISEDDILKKFWELEDQPRNTKIEWNEEEQKCEELFNSTTKRTKEGRYVVKLPFRNDQPRCLGGSSRQIAEARFKALERKLSKDSDLKGSYKDVMNEYLLLGHMRSVDKNDKKREQAVYLPHHAVVRNDKSTTKVRVVFNASSKNKLGVSLNDELMIGPKLQADLRHLILRWRVHPIVLIADIIKMYRQIRIAEEDAVFQRILWRETPENEMQDYELLTVTFGTTSAPYQAVRALNQVSYDEGQDYPLASARVVNSFYMDDLMTGCVDVKEGVEVYKQMTELLSRACFKLQKWNSNSKELLAEINLNEAKRNNISNKQSESTKKEDKQIQEYIKQGEDKAKEIKNKKDNTQDKDKQILKEKENFKDKAGIEIKAENTTKILGITWDRSEDCFQYTVKLPTTTAGPETKRTIISVIARLYDPLSWLAPAIILAKMFIQKLWLAGITWDEPVSAELKDEWYTYRNELTQLTAVRVPRWVGTIDTSTELHGFSDASKLAYAAVVYLRVVDHTGHRQVSLLAAKTRVAPIKQVSIPRLELCGAVLLSRLLREVAEVFKIDKGNIKAWTDSTVVLAWLNSHPSRWKTFVANRVSEILTNLDSSQWHHVMSKQNPADCASRGVQPGSLAANELWFHGPQFLREQVISYTRPMELKVHLEEAVKAHVSTMPEDTVFTRFSSLQRLLRVIAYCRRFYKRDSSRTTYLKKTEIDEARICCIKKAQRQEFAEDYAQLKDKSRVLAKSSKLRSLCPYLDETGIMRVSGRLQKSELAEETKHPILLPHSSHFTKLVVANAHQATLHGGTQLTVNYLRNTYWIVGVRNLVKQHIHRCVVCVRQGARVQNQFMGSLPSVRCTPARPFLHSGVDYAGPIKIRTTKGRGNLSHKGYICLFICMATKAIHLEVVSDMSTQAFLAAFRRFVSRRGHCTQMWSDNGTTFVGASKELEQLNTIQQDVAEHLATQGTEWHFIPPHAPNHGGLWEAGVKSTKFHLKRVIGESTLTYEEMSTLLSQVEACLNSRPITVDYSNPNEPLPLTPGHFLVGGPLLAVPEIENYMESGISTLTRWQLIQKMLQDFWRRWSLEYLSNLMNRYKWNSRVPEPNIGDLVLIKEDDLPPSRWLMGRVVEKHPGTDNITRVVTLRTKASTLKRPTSKLCILPVNE